MNSFNSSKNPLNSTVMNGYERYELFLLVYIYIYVCMCVCNVNVWKLFILYITIHKPYKINVLKFSKLFINYSWTIHRGREMIEYSTLLCSFFFVEMLTMLSTWENVDGSRCWATFLCLYVDKPVNTLSPRAMRVWPFFVSNVDKFRQ